MFRNYKTIALAALLAATAAACTDSSKSAQPVVAGRRAGREEGRPGDRGDDHRQGPVRRHAAAEPGDQHVVRSRVHRDQQETGHDRVGTGRQRRPAERVRLYQGRARQQVPLRHADRSGEAGSEGLPLRAARRRAARRPSRSRWSTATTRCTTCTACRRPTASSTRGSRCRG